MDRVAIALGSNLGDRHAHLDYAVARLHTLLDDLTVSTYYETEPVDAAEPQPLFLNAAVVGTTDATPRAVLQSLLRIEAERGRARSHPNAARTLDLDLVLFGNLVIAEPDLTVPHSRFRERRFVLAPLAEIAADWRDPVTGKTIRELLAGVR